MTYSLHYAIAEAVRADLAGESWDQTFTPKALWRVRYALTELAELQVSVVPGPSRTTTPLTRARDDERYTVDVILQKQVDPDKLDQVDPLVKQLEAFRDHYRRKQLSANSRKMVCLEREFLAPSKAGIAREILEDDRVFNSVLRLHWQATGAPP